MIILKYFSLPFIFMEIEQTGLQKNFSVRYKNKLYFVDYVNSDGQDLRLLNRDNWEIYDEDHESLQIYTLSSMTKEEKLKIQKNLKFAEKLIKFCMQHFEDYNPVKDEK